jgi:N-acetyl-gamma-glutamyl-phosphate reductase
MIKVGIIGAAGYTGAELLRILLRHTGVELCFAHSRSHSGQPVSVVHTDLWGETDLRFAAEIDCSADLLFLCSGHGEARRFLEQHPLPPKMKIIDLSQDFRIEPEYSGRSFVYGLPEMNRSDIANAANIANPGCFATALQLGLLPLVSTGFSGSVYATGITGSTGAGQSLSASSHFSWRNNNIQPYKSLQHQHIAEVRHQLAQRHPAGDAVPINFIPWRGDFSRGIMVSLQCETPLSYEQLINLYSTYYDQHPFTHFYPGDIHLKQVVHTNKCLIGIDFKEGQCAIHIALDNLLKGASGQAVQNMNLMFGLEEDCGLNLKAGYY